MAKKDYYMILGVPRFETSSGIHEAFRKLAKKYHPDLSGPETAERFREIAHAYEILSDPEQRRSYDENLRREHDDSFHGRKRAWRAEPLHQERRPGGYRPEPLIPDPMPVFHHVQTWRPSPNALFDTMFVAGMGASQERAEELNFDLLLSAFEAARGLVAGVRIPLVQSCLLCGGSGKDWLFPCMSCRGQGRVEKEAAVSVRIPPMVRDRTIIEVPIEFPGFRNSSLRLHVRISP